MSSHPLREGFRQICRDPALLLIEIGWRWAFGTVACVVTGFSALLLLHGVPVDSRQLKLLFDRSPLELAQWLAGALASFGVTFLRTAIAAMFFLAVWWIIASAVGRHATLQRPALAPGATLRGCLAISFVRALITLAALVGWGAAGIIAGLIGAATGRDATLNMLPVLAILVPALILIVSAWSAANWYLSLAPLFPERHWGGSMARGWKLIHFRRDDVLEIFVATGVIRTILFLAAMMLSIAASAVITNPRVLLTNLVAIMLLYLLIADFVYVARMAAYAQLRIDHVAELPSESDLRGVPADSLAAQAATPVPHIP